MVLPMDFIRGNSLHAGDLLDLRYDDVVRVRPLKRVVASDTEGRNPGVPAAQPAQPDPTDGVSVSGAD